ncbi:hypothetical protein MYCTH_2301676 [Thermothelomyces thermophilus ATCC 42464]|uniref:Uncharacterized protein n=1 Tax=Thermothelomyces thermophilus (strain ATCC 42464 / BCRC 31852 / DSM 1799) TaxID=573729 RepID=G2Q9X3_THET4|nr:uncharacterized protein MYCTH_2301676 [Thermothelomyces thermophilus ATCC 42464]AEO56582.1 hypothetical protein MYCTH_2301676 [Thermothelomyces thermophilus ATCC 42464]
MPMRQETVAAVIPVGSACLGEDTWVHRLPLIGFRGDYRRMIHVYTFTASFPYPRSVR